MSKRKKDPRGRPKLSKAEKCTALNLTFTPKGMEKVALIKRTRSNFFNHIAQHVPIEMIREFNRSPKRFLSSPLSIGFTQH